MPADLLVAGSVDHLTLGRLEASVQQYNLAVSAIHYRYYHEVDTRGFTDGLDQFFHKRIWGRARERSTPREGQCGAL